VEVIHTVFYIGSGIFIDFWAVLFIRAECGNSAESISELM